MLAVFYFVLAFLPLLAQATFWPPQQPKPVCGTSTSTCYKTTTVPGPNPTTVYCTVGDWGCYTTSTCDRYVTNYQTVTQTRTVTNCRTATVTGTPTKTVTRTNCVNTKTVCLNHYKRNAVPTGLAERDGFSEENHVELTNAERLKRGLPLKAPHGRRTFGHWNPNPGPSCTPTTVVTTGTKTVTKNTVTATKTTCRLTKTVYGTKTLQGTKTCYATTTVAGPAQTVTRPPACGWTTTVTQATTATITKSWCWW